MAHSKFLNQRMRLLSHLCYLSSLCSAKHWIWRFSAQWLKTRTSPTSYWKPSLTHIETLSSWWIKSSKTKILKLLAMDTLLTQLSLKKIAIAQDQDLSSSQQWSKFGCKMFTKCTESNFSSLSRKFSKSLFRWANSLILKRNRLRYLRHTSLSES